MKFTLHLLPAALLLSSSPAARAVTYAYEGFNGYSSGALSPQAVSSNTVGLNTSTTITNAGAAGLNNTFQSGGMSFSDLAVTGGSALFSSSNGGASYIGYAYNGTNVSGTLYSSYLVNIGTAQNVASVVSLRVNLTSTTGGSSSYFHAFADVNGSTFTGSQYETSNAFTASTQSLAVGTIYAVIGRFTNVGTALSAGTPGVGTTYVLTADQFDFFKAGGFTDAELDAATIGSGSSNITSRVSDANVTTGTFTLNSGNAIQFGPGNAGVNQSVAYDELRFGSSLNDVLPVPEPSVSLTLLAALGFLTAGRRRP